MDHRFPFPLVRRLLRWLNGRRGRDRPGSPGDPYIGRPVRLNPRPHTRRGAAAVAEPDGR